MRTFRAGNRETAEVQRLAADIERAAFQADPMAGMYYIEVAPDKPRDGLYLAAAGVLGANRGLYRYDSDSATYTFIA